MTPFVRVCKGGHKRVNSTDGLLPRGVWKSRAGGLRPYHQVARDQHTQRRSGSKPENRRHYRHRPEPTLKNSLAQVKRNECARGSPKRPKDSCEPRKLQRGMARRATDFIGMRECCRPRYPHKTQWTLSFPHRCCRLRASLIFAGQKVQPRPPAGRSRARR
jgi:hypothetical protein